MDNIANVWLSKWNFPWPKNLQPLCTLSSLESVSLVLRPPNFHFLPIGMPSSSSLFCPPILPSSFFRSPLASASPSPGPPAPGFAYHANNESCPPRPHLAASGFSFGAFAVDWGTIKASKAWLVPWPPAVPCLPLGVSGCNPTWPPYPIPPPLQHKGQGFWRASSCTEWSLLQLSCFLTIWRRRMVLYGKARYLMYLEKWNATVGRYIHFEENGNNRNRLLLSLTDLAPKKAA